MMCWQGSVGFGSLVILEDMAALWFGFAYRVWTVSALEVDQVISEGWPQFSSSSAFNAVSMHNTGTYLWCSIVHKDGNSCRHRSRHERPCGRHPEVSIGTHFWRLDW